MGHHGVSARRSVDAADYDARLGRLVGVGATVDTATVAWYARLSETFPTLEVRVADAQLEPAPALLLTALTRALVATGVAEAEAGAPPWSLEPELLDAALWHASRDGIRGELLGSHHPAAGAGPAGDRRAAGLRGRRTEAAGDRPG